MWKAEGTSHTEEQVCCSWIKSREEAGIEKQEGMVRVGSQADDWMLGLIAGPSSSHKSWK